MVSTPGTQGVRGRPVGAEAGEGAGPGETELWRLLHKIRQFPEGFSVVELLIQFV